MITRITDDLYKETILDHNRNPRNFRKIEDPSCSVAGDNPLCGDKLEMYVKINGGIIEDISFTGSGCAISKASASLLTEAVTGKSTEEAMKLFEKIHRILTARKPEDVDPEDVKSVGKLRVLSGVCEFPMRVKCASLAWHTLKAAIHKENQTVTTE